MSAQPCIERRFESEHHAKEAHRKASYRIRAYFCRVCHGWHVTNSEKRHSQNRKLS